MRLLRQPAAEHGRVRRQVVNAIHVREPQALLASVVVVHPLRCTCWDQPLGVTDAARLLCSLRSLALHVLRLSHSQSTHLAY